MTINFTDFGLTSAIDPTDPTKVTADAQLRVSDLSDSLGLIADYTQGTNANKMLWSRSDNRENLQRASENDFNNATYWTPANSTAVDGAITVGGLSMSSLTAAASTSQHSIFSAAGSNITMILGQSYEQSYLVKAGTHRYVQIAFFAGPFGNGYVNFDILAGTVGTTGLGMVGGIEVHDAANGVYRIWARDTNILTATTGSCFLIMVGSASATRGQSFAAAGTEVIYFTRAQFRNVLTDPTYLPTTDHPQYAGVNGRRWLVLNGAQLMASTSTLANIFTNASKLFYIVLEPWLLNAAQAIFNPNGQYTVLNINASGSQARWQNFNSSYQTTEVGLAVNTPVILRGRHAGGSIYLAKDEGAGFGAEDVEVSGNTDVMTGVLRLGATSAGFYGKLGGVFTANTGIAKPNFENLLREYYFARSQLIWDPYLAELVLKRSTVIG
jgi:hypothetical protein